jgi:signal transduction histidine kinase/ligand-binding sensor domain-containing protein
MLRRRLSVAIAGLVAVLGLQPQLRSAAPDRRETFERVVKQSWKTEHGLPQSTVTSIAQTSDGYIWVGTFGGVARFDGVRFTVFDAANTPGFLNNRILDLLEDRDHTLWVGTEGGLSKREKGRWSTLTTADTLPSAYITSLAEDADGVVWAGTNNGVAAVRNGGVVRGPWEQLTRGQAARVVAGRRGDVWAVAGRRLFDIKRGKPVEVPYSIEHDEALPSSMFEDREGTLWVGFADVTWRRHANGRWSVLLDTRWGAYRLGSASITENESGHVVFVSDQDIFWYRKGILVAREPVAPGITDQLRVVRFDRDGGMWIGADSQGLEVWRRPRVTALGPADGFPTGSVVPVLADRVGRIWTGAPCRGIRAVPVAPSRARAIVLDRPGCVWALAEDRAGDIWAGSYGGGLHRIREGRIVGHYTTDQGLVHNGINSLFFDRSGTLWIGTAKGVSTFKGGRFTTVPLTAEDAGLGVHFITQDRAGAIWIAARGLIRVAGNDIQRFDTKSGLSNNAVRAIYEDRDSALWIGTYGGGLNRLKDGRFTSFSTRNGLIDNTVSMVIEDAKGNFWLNGNAGISRVARQDLNDLAEGRRASVEVGWYGMADGMKNREGNGGGQPSGSQTKDGRIWFPTLDGVVMVDTNELRPSPPPVLIEEARADERLLDMNGETRIGPGAGKVEFAYTAFAYGNPSSLRFKVLLEGYDTDWVDAGERRQASYTNLPPGTYHFRVIARSNDGVWSEPSQAVTFQLEPHFYQTAWFQALATLVGFGVMWVAYAVSVRGLEARAKKLSALVDERTQAQEALKRTNTELESAMVQLRQAQQALVQQERIRALGQMASGIAHDINNSLAPILGYSDLLLSSDAPHQDPELVPSLQAINTSAQDAASVVRRLIQFYRPKAGGPALPAVDLALVIDQVLLLTQPRWKTEPESRGATITVEQQIPPLPPVAADPSELREALTNIVFNAVEAMPDGGVIRFTGEETAGGVALSISDTGIGMTEDEASKCFEPFFSTKGEKGTGLGLATVFGAVQRFSGTITVTSARGKGTTFTITLPRFQAGPEAVQPEEAAPVQIVPPMRVLLVDDELPARHLIESFLNNDGHVVTAADDGRAGLEEFSRGAFDLVITDRAMPVMNGVQMVAGIRRMNRDVPVIMLSGYGDIMRASGDHPEGVTLVLAKPVTLRDFRKALADVKLES